MPYNRTIVGKLSKYIYRARLSSRTSNVLNALVSTVERTGTFYANV